jgi:F-type H+-transporting ATPase subunit gamma
MSSTKIIRRRIKSATNISKITKAMEMVAASKMRHAQEVALSSRPYTEKMRQILTDIIEIMKQDVSHFLLETPKLVGKKDAPKKNLVIVLSSDKGLCGGLNSNLYRGLESWQTDLLERNPDLKDTRFEFITVGKKAKEHIMKTNRFLLAEFPSHGDKPRYRDIVPLYDTVYNSFEKGEYQKVYIVFMEFISTIVQRLSVRQLLPIQKDSINETFEEIMLEEKSVKFEFHKDYIFEPNVETVFNKLLPKYLGLYMYHIILESIASEHSARMVAMKSAHDNATDIVKDLSLEYNQLRQQKITNELLDSISARMVM